MNQNTIIEQNKRKNEINKDKGLFEKSFSITSLILILAFFITLFTSFFITIPKLRTILFTEMAITIIASMMYLLFNTILTMPDFLSSFIPYINLEHINTLRYLGWSITTPLMLVALCLILAFNLKIDARPGLLWNVIGLDWIMLLFGVLGETGTISLNYAMFFGFIPFFLMFYLIYKGLIEGRRNYLNSFIFSIYFLLWVLYGIIYQMDVKWKTIITNILDCTAKALFAIGLSIQYLYYY